MVDAKKIFLLFILLVSQNVRSQTTTNDSCHKALPFCGSCLYSFAAGVSPGWGTDAEVGPSYGCLSSQPNPAWYFMQIATAGDIIIQMQSSPLRDIDYICWGPYSSPTGACVSGLTFSKIVDCSYSTSATEVCTILNAQVGAFYLLLITNYSNQPCGVTFSQTNYGQPGAGSTNCDIVTNCSIFSLSAAPGPCVLAGGQFNVSGVIEFANAPTTGQLTITDITAVPNISQTFSAPFTSPQTYFLSNIPCDGLVHTINAAFTDSTACTFTQTYNAPSNLCPNAIISGGGIICNNGIDQAIVTITFTQGSPPYSFAYALNGVPQPSVINYSGPFPYQINTSTPGTYTLVSVSNVICPIGTVSGSAVVTLQPLPVPTIIGQGSACAGTSGNVYFTQPGMLNYIWNISPGGTITGGIGSNTITVTWNATGPQTINVIYTDAALCTAASPTTFNVTVNSLPVPTIAGPAAVCVNTSGNIYTTQPGMSNYSWTVSAGGTITAGGTPASNSVTVTWNTAGAQSVRVGYTDFNLCTSAVQTIYPQTVNPSLPSNVSIMANPAGPICAGTSVTFTATPVNGGPSPSFQWKNGGVNIPGATNPTYTTTTLANADAITVEMISNANCATGSPSTSNTIIMIVNPLLPVSVSIAAAPSGAICPGTSVTFTATPTNGGLSPTYQWKKGGVNILGATGSAYTTSTLVNADAITVEITSNANCATGSPATSNTLVITVNPLIPASVNIAAIPAGTICPGTSVTFSASPTNGGITPAYQWKKGGINIPGATNSTYTTTILLNGDAITVVMTSNAAPCLINSPAVSNTITGGVFPNPSPTITGSAPICVGTIGNVYTTQSGMTNYAWNVSAGGTITAGGSLNDDFVTVSWVTTGPQSVSVNYTSGNGCTAPLPVVYPVLVKPKPSVTNPQRSYMICSNTGTNIVLQSSIFLSTFTWAIGTVSASITGYSNGTGSSINQTLLNSGNLLGTVTYSVTPTANGCSGDTANFIVSVNASPDVSFLPPNPSICSGQSATVSLISATPGTLFSWSPVSASPQITGQSAGAGNTIIQTLGNPQPVPGTVTYKVQPVVNGCSGTSRNLDISVNPIPSVKIITCNDLNTTKNARPIILKGGRPSGSGSQYSGIGITQISPGVYEFDPMDIQVIPSFFGTNYTITYQYTNSFGCFNEDSQKIKVFLSNAAQPCPGIVNDVRDNTSYRTFLSGSGATARCWMEENLNFGTAITNPQNTPQRDNCVVEKYCADNLLTQCAVSGGFYQWDELLQYSNTEGSQGICPPGWHVPSEQDWEDLLNNNQGPGLAGDPLKNPLAANGFHGLTRGLYYLDQQWSFNTGITRGSMFWTSTSPSTFTAIARGLNSTNQSVSFYASSRANAFNVRCVKD